MITASWYGSTAASRLPVYEIQGRLTERCGPRKMRMIAGFIRCAYVRNLRTNQFHNREHVIEAGFERLLSVATDLALELRQQSRLGTCHREFPKGTSSRVGIISRSHHDDHREGVGIQ